MTTGFIELNDTGIVQALDGQRVETSIGFAVLDGERLMVGEEARRNARLLPRWTNNRFWDQLNMDPLANATRSIRHHADLAFAQLEDIGKRLEGASEIIMAVPGFYSKEELGLLLGMAKEAGLPIEGLVDSSLLAVSREPLTGNVLHLDIHLHRVTLTICRFDGVLRRVETRTLAETGLFTLWDRWANVVARQFIQTSRYDPMHQAASEQKLFDTLPEWLQQTSGRSSRSFELDLGDVKHTTNISNEQLVSACANLYPAIVQAIRAQGQERADLFVSHRLAGLPGLKESLALLPNVDVSYLDPDAAVVAAHWHRERLLGTAGQVSHVNQLPATARSASGDANQSVLPTHALVGHRATPLAAAMKVQGISTRLDEGHGEPAFTLSRARDHYLLSAVATGVTVNGQPVQGDVQLNAGDQVGFGDKTCTLIVVG